MATATKTREYTEASIGMLEGLEAVRHRPSMDSGAPDLSRRRPDETKGDGLSWQS
ncbi:MAG: hypothetical protein HYR84_02170 [Planctomycetes bacterium]|nr:hypothetical protein [Planctomycetota bacterium]